MKTKQVIQDSTKENKYSRTLNINKKKNLKYKSKSNSKIDRKLIKPIKIKNLNKLKSNILQNKKNTNLKNEKKEKEIDASLEEYLYKEEIPPIINNSNKNNINILEKNYIKINNKTPNKIIKTIKTQLISNNDIHNVNNIRNYNTNLINGGNERNTHGKLNLNITLNNKSPVRLRKINMNKKYNYRVNCLSTYKKEKQINTIYFNNNKNMNMDLNMNIYNNDLTSNDISNINNNDEMTIINLKEEIENQKRENLYKEIVINDMKKQLDDINRDKENKLLNGNFINSLNEDIYLLKEELDMLNDKVINDINYSSLNNDKNFNKEEAILFDKLKVNYSNNKSLINKLKSENENLKNKIKDKTINGNQKKYNSYSIRELQNIYSFNYLGNENTNQLDDYNNNIDLDLDIPSDYVEKILKSSIKDYFDIKKENEIDDEKKNIIKLMIKMNLNSNYINEDEIISLFMNNLLNLKNPIERFCVKYLKINNLQDKEIIHNYFKLICFDKNKQFNINNIFREIVSFFDRDIKKLEQIKIKEYFSEKNKQLNQIIKECKFIDNQNNGLIEFNQFKKILNKIQFFKDFKEDENKIFNLLLYNMKKNLNLEDIGLFQLSYNNLPSNLELNDSINNFSDTNSLNSLIIDKNEKEKKNSLFYKTNEEKDEKQMMKNDVIENAIKRKITSNVDFKPNKNEKERGSENSNNTYGLLSSNKFSFDYSSKSGSKEAGFLKEGLKKITSEFTETEEYLNLFCKEYVDNLFNIILEDIKRKKINVHLLFGEDIIINKK